MCGRYAITLPPEAMVGLFEGVDISALGNLEPRWNVAPSQNAPVIARSPDGELQAKSLRWGLHPVWMKEPPGAKSMINARSETAAEKPFFRDALKKRRCLVPADGFYEWHRVGTTKSPYWISRADETPMVMAGLWERWRADEASDWVRTFAFLTAPASLDIAHLHDRTPVILSPDHFAEWLDSETSPDRIKALMAAPPPGTLRHWEVSSQVNSVRNDTPNLRARVT
jgi:putative SOS response-associated peptidase YedK